MCEVILKRSIQTICKNNYYIKNVKLDEEKKKFLAQPNPPKEKRRRVIKEFRNLIPNVKKTSITVNEVGKVRMIVLDKVDIQQPKNVSQVLTERMFTQTISFNLPDNYIDCACLSCLSCAQTTESCLLLAGCCPFST